MKLKLLGTGNAQTFPVRCVEKLGIYVFHGVKPDPWHLLETLKAEVERWLQKLAPRAAKRERSHEEHDAEHS